MSEKDVILDKKNENENVVLDKNKTQAELEKEKITKDLTLFFDNIISKGYMTREVKLTEDLTIELKVLDTWETLQADSRIPLLFVEGVRDVSSRARIISELATATISVNGIDIKREDLTDKENALRVEELYQKYLKLPPSLLDKLQQEYVKLSNEQLDFYTKPEELSEKIENF